MNSFTNDLPLTIRIVHRSLVITWKADPLVDRANRLGPSVRIHYMKTGHRLIRLKCVQNCNLKGSAREL